MFRGDRHRRKGQANPPASVPTTLLQSSSFSPSSMLHRAAPPSNLSQPDIVTSDHSAASPLPTPTKKQFSTAAAVSPAPRSSSLGAMGQSYSQSQSPVPPSPLASSFSSPAGASKGSKLKRAFGVGRKQAEDANPSSLALEKTRSRGKDNNASVASLTQAAPARRPLGAKQLSLQLASAFSTKQNPPPVVSPTFGLPPPPLPPKNSVLQVGKLSVLPSEPAVNHRGSVMTSSPSIAPAIQYLQHGEPIPEKEAAGMQRTKVEKKDQEKAETKEGWRKSDSNMSFNTIRPGAASIGNRNSRPVSMAESLQSTHTIVPVNKRLSALVTEAEFVMAEEDDGERGQDMMPTPLSSMTSGTTSPSGSLKSRNRRSASLNLPLPFAKMKGSFAPNAIADERFARSSADNPRLPPSSSAWDIPASTQGPGSNYVTPTSSNVSLQSTNGNTKGRLAWSATSSPTQHERMLPDVPSYQPRISPDGKVPPSLRQTAVSISNGFAPAAGLAKRAVEKMGRAWGGMHSASGSGYSSSSSTGTAPSTYSGHSVEDLGRPMPGYLAPGSKGKRRTPNAPSGSWSMTSSTTSSSISDSDAYSVPAGPFLGQCVRGPTRFASEAGGMAKGAVFGRDLRSCVVETALQAAAAAETGDASNRSMHSMTASDSKAQKDLDNRELESRRIPALVARCAQHILIWGVQEEGLFRVTGRPTHVSRIRAEFDTGADYDLSECNVGDLDPHAVSSVFKAYLRELPEPILTHALMPYFDAALSTETQNRESHETPQVARGMRGPNLLMGPNAGGGIPAMRKPPSLTTLAMPNFSTMPPPSESFISALKSLIAALPQENRDLLRTVTDLIKETAKRSKETKMPLSNLLLVFCPSLNMNPPLLRALCEAEGIWDLSRSSSEDPDVTAIKQGTVAIDIGPGSSGSPSDRNNGGPATTSDKNQGQVSPEGNHEITLPDRHTNPSEVEATSNSNLEATYGSRPIPRPQTGTRRAPVATLYMDSECGDDDVSRQSFQTCVSTFFPASSPEGSSSHDDVSISRSSSVSPALPNPHSPPSLSSSTDSLATPSTISSGAPSSASHLPLSDDQDNKSQISSPPESLVIVEPTDLPLPSTPRRHNINYPVAGEIQFPMAGSAPTTPMTRRPPPAPLSLTGYSPLLNGPASSPSSLRARRIKKPSLHLLFTRRSSASLHSASVSTASISGPTPFIPTSSTSSTPTPLSMFTPKSSASSLPPMLDMTIETSPLKLGLDDSKRNSYVPKPGSSRSTQTVTKTPELKYDRSPSPFGTPGPHETPIANLYSTPSGSVLSFDTSEYVQPARPRPKPTQRPSQLSVASSTASFDHLSMVLPDEDAPADDWAQSVLAAADVNGTWSVKNAMKFFGGGS